MFENVRNRLLSMISIIPVLFGIHLAGIQQFFEKDIVKLLTFSDYITLAIRSSGPAILIIIVSFLAGIYVLNNIGKDSYKPMSKWTYVFVSIMILFIITANTVLLFHNFELLASLISVRGPQIDLISSLQFAWIAITILLSIRSAEKYVLIKNSKGINLLDNRFDVIAFIALSFPTFMEPYRQILAIQKRDPIVLSACLLDNEASSRFIMAAERGLIVRINDKLHLVSYDCLKSASFK